MAATPSLARRERERAATRQKILNAARRMLVQHGYEGTTMRATAAKIGYTPTAIYHYFKDKDALVAELSAIDYRAFSQALQRTGITGNPVERLGKIGEAYVEFAQMAWASVHGLVSLRVAKGDDPSFPWRDVRQVREKLSGVFRRGLARGTET